MRGLEAIYDGSSAVERSTVLRRVLSVLTALFVMLGVVTMASPALAHDALIASNPAAGAALSEAPAQLVLTYNAEIASIGAEVAITAPDGASALGGDLTIAGTEVTVPLAPDLANGAYAIAWRVTSSDGHPISGELAFTLDAPVAETTEPATTEPATTETATEAATTDAATTEAATSDSPTPAPSTTTPAMETNDFTPQPWLAVVLGLAVLGTGAALFLRARRNPDGLGVRPTAPKAPETPQAPDSKDSK